MSSTLYVTFPAPPVDRDEIFRYAEMKEPTEEANRLLSQCLEEGKDAFSYRVCYRILPLEIQDGICTLEDFPLCSQNLNRHLSGCDRVAVFAATVGFGVDRLIGKYAALSPARALMFQAMGTERVEALCDAFCRFLNEKGHKTTLRFSPGYGDLPLECQKTVFSLLDCTRTCGITLNDSLLMSPTKSVTAFVGLKNN